MDTDKVYQTYLAEMKGIIMNIQKTQMATRSVSTKCWRKYYKDVKKQLRGQIYGTLWLSHRSNRIKRQKYPAQDNENEDKILMD